MSRFAFARPIKHKNGQEVAEVLEDIFTESQRHPKFYLQTDEGKEFFNKHVKELASKYGFKAAIVERFNRTLKKKSYGVILPGLTLGNGSQTAKAKTCWLNLSMPTTTGSTPPWG